MVECGEYKSLPTQIIMKNVVTYFVYVALFSIFCEKYYIQNIFITNPKC